MNVVRLVPPRPAKPHGDRATAALAALIILTDGAARVGKTAVYAAVLLLAALGVISLLGR